MSAGENGSLPKSMRHKQILDVAAENPDASVTEIASMVPSATPELVERVFDEHGDPASENTDSDTEEKSVAPSVGEVEAEENATQSDSESQPDEEAELPSPESLSEKQRAVLRAIAANPDATQREIGEQLDVSSATVSNRVNSIEGFEWGDRQSIVETLLDEDTATETTAPAASAGTDSQTDEKPTETPALSTLESTVEQLEKQVATLEKRLDETDQSDENRGESPFDDPELAHKIVHSCIESDRITEDEELQILKQLLD